MTLPRTPSAPSRRSRVAPLVAAALGSLLLASAALAQDLRPPSAASTAGAAPSSSAPSPEVAPSGPASPDAEPFGPPAPDAEPFGPPAPDAEPSGPQLVPAAPVTTGATPPGSPWMLDLPPLPADRPSNPAVTDGPSPEPAPIAPEERPGIVIKTILGLVALLALAYIGGHPRVQEWERRVGISQMITAGFPFVALGVVARLPQVGILTDSVLAGLGPLLRFGLGWIGFIVGFRFDVGLIEKLPDGTVSFVAWRAFAAFTAIGAAAALVLLGANGFTRAALTDPVFLRDALVLGTAGSLTSLATPKLLEARGADPEAVLQVSRVVRVAEVAGVLGLLVVAAYFRPQGTSVTWQLPGTAWLLLALGAGIVIGILVYMIMLRSTASSAESLVMILGSVAFASGMASNLRLSPVVVCFVAGLVVANFPGAYKERLAATLARMERPIYLMFLLVVGSLWRVGEWQGWLLMAAFVVARLVGMWIGTRGGATAEGLALKPDARSALTVAPIGALSIAIVVNAEILYPGGSISSLVTAIVGGAIVTEVLMQKIARETQRRNLGVNGTPIPGSWAPAREKKDTSAEAAPVQSTEEGGAA